MADRIRTRKSVGIVSLAMWLRWRTRKGGGSGIPLYRSRIELCKDYAEKLTNAEAKAFFLDDIKGWEKNIEEERLRNANEKAIYG